MLLPVWSWNEIEKKMVLFFLHSTLKAGAASSFRKTAS